MLHVWLHRIDVKLMAGNGTRPGIDIEQRNGCRMIWQVTKDWSLGGYSTDVDQLPSKIQKNEYVPMSSRSKQIDIKETTTMNGVCSVAR